jgi:hypothetical protein
VRQLRLQRIAFADQTRVQERQQADAIDVAGRPFDGSEAKILPPGDHQPVHAIIVTNGSRRPIREVAAKIQAIEADETIRREKLADIYGEMAPVGIGPSVQVDTFVLRARAGIMPVLRTGQKAGFGWDFTVVQYPRFLVWVRFTDDAGLHWEISTDLHLEKLATRNW